jgi:propanediol utilization protein
VIIVGPKGVITAKGSVIVAKAHVHMTPADAQKYGVDHGQSVSIRLGTERSVTLNDVQVRVSKDFSLAVHIDYDEANAAQVGGGNIVGYLLKNG